MIVALVDADDIHILMIGASGIGKTVFFPYPNLEYACAVQSLSSMMFSRPLSASAVFFVRVTK